MDDKLRKSLVIFILVFFLAWTLIECYVNPVLEELFSDVLSSIISRFIKVSIWTLPAIIQIRIYREYLSVKYLLKCSMNSLKVLIIGLSIVTLYLGIVAYVTHGELSINPNFSAGMLIIILFVGITEEVYFRGWLLNIHLTLFSQRLAFVLNSALFVLIHIPIFISKGTVLTNFANGTYLSLFIVSIFFSISFTKSKNIFVPMCTHMYYNLMISLFIAR